MKMLEAERPGVGPCRTLLVEIAPTTTFVRNTSKIQVALCNFGEEGQAHRRGGAARVLRGLGKSGGLTPPQPTQGSFEGGKREEGED